MCNWTYTLLLFALYLARCDSECKPYQNKSEEELTNDRRDLYEECNNDYEQEAIASTLADICDDGLIDVAVQTISGQVYLFKRFGFVIINLDGTKTNKSYVTKFTFPFLPLKPEWALTITDPHNIRYGLSLFYKSNKFYVYEDTFFQTIVTAQAYNLKVGENKPFYYYGDSILAFYDKKFSSVEMYIRKVFNFLDFHTIEFPDFITQEAKQNIQNFFNYVNQIVALPNDSWIVFLSYEIYGTFCMIPNVSTTTYFTCYERELTDLLDCPGQTNEIVTANWLIKIWESSSLSQDRLMATFKAILIGLMYGLSVLYLITYFRYGEYVSGSTISSSSVNGL